MMAADDRLYLSYPEIVTMADAMTTPQGDGTPLSPPTPPAPPGDAAASSRGGRYDANMQLIRRRLADDERMNKARRWWPKKS